MLKLGLSGASVASVVLISGCGIAGSWQAVTVSPADGQPPFAYMTLDAQGQFTATTKDDGASRTSTGSYSWNGRTLRLRSEGSAERVYTGYVRMDGALVLSLDDQGGEVRTTWKRIRF